MAMDTSTGLLPKVTVHLRQFFCGLHGHDDLLHFGEGRLSLHCASCGYESPGWELERGAKAPAEAAARPPIARTVGHERRVA